MSEDQTNAAMLTFLEWFSDLGLEHAQVIVAEKSMNEEVEYWHFRQCELLEQEGIPFAHVSAEQSEILAAVEAYTLGWSAQDFADYIDIVKPDRNNIINDILANLHTTVH